MVEQNLTIKDDNGKLFVNNDNVDAIALFYFNEQNTFKLMLNGKKSYVNNIDRFTLDILISLQEFITKDDRKTFTEFNKQLDELFNDFRRNVQDVLVARHKTTGVSDDLEIQS